MTDLYAVFGNPIAHSKSPAIHAAFAAATGQQLRYEARLAPIDAFPQAIADFVAAGGKGRFVQLPPYKQDGHPSFTGQPAAWRPSFEAFQGEVFGK